MNDECLRSYVLRTVYEATAINTKHHELPTEIAKGLKLSDPTIFSLLKSTHDILSAVDIPWIELADRIGIIVVGNAYPRQYSKKVVNELSIQRRVSPMSFINANAGAAISICCTTFKFRGPTINLTMSDNIRSEIAAFIAKQWLTNNDAKYLFIVTSDFNADDECIVHNKLITSA